MNKKYFLICITFILLINEILAQYDGNNLKKYWYYRQRLIDYFMVVGGGQGESLVTDIRNNTFHGELTNPTGIEYGDQTLYMGWYLGVLATEYKLLNDNGQNVTRIAEELYFALFAINRLDITGETRFPAPAGENRIFKTNFHTLCTNIIF